MTKNAAANNAGRSCCQLTRGPDTPETARLDLRIDLYRALNALPIEMRQFARRLQTMTPTMIAQATGVPRTSIHDRIQRLRGHLRQAGLGEYLGITSVKSKAFPVDSN